MTDAPPWQESVLRTTLARQAGVTISIAESLSEEQDFSTRTPPDLAAAIISISKVLQRHCETAPKEMLRHIHVFLSRMGSHLRFIERARIAQTPWSMLPSLEAFLHSFAGEHSRFVIRPQWGYNYRTTSELLGSYRQMLSSLSFVTAEEVASAIPNANQEIYCVSFPRAERLNAPLHANFAHELGHIAAARWIRKESPKFWSSVQIEIHERIQKEVYEELEIDPEAPPDLFKSMPARAQIASQESTCKQLYVDGLRELIADAVAVHVLGPAAILAESEMAAREEFEGSPIAHAYYPPWCFRLRLMLEACPLDAATLDPSKDRHWVAGLMQWMTRLKNSLSPQRDQAVFDLDLRTQLAYAAIKEHWPTIREGALGDFLKDRPIYSLSERLEVIDKLVARLAGGVIPDEVGVWNAPKPASLEDILTAAWVFKVGVHEGQIECEYSVNDEVLSRLVLKALESSYVQRVYGEKLRLKES